VLTEIYVIKQNKNNTTGWPHSKSTVGMRNTTIFVSHWSVSSATPINLYNP